jgi:hypothetical protein
MNVEFLLGLDFSGYYIRLTEVKREDGKISVSNIDQIKTEVDFHDPLLYDMISDPDIALHIVSNLTKLFNRNNIKARKVSITLSAASSLLLTVPMDKNLSADQKRQNLLWEISNYYPSVAPDTFNVALYPLNSDDNSCSYLLAAVHKEIILFLKNILSGMNFNAVQFDIDHFAALKSTVSRALEMDRRTYCLIGFRGNYIDIGKIQDSALSVYSAAFVNEKEDQIMDLIKSFLTGKIEEPCYFYGDKINSEIINTLAQYFNLKYYGILDSFQSVELPSSIDISKKIVFNQSDYVFSIGSLLRLK